MPAYRLGAVDARRLLAVTTAAAGAGSIGVTVAIRMNAADGGEGTAALWLILEPLALALLVAAVVRWSNPWIAVVCGSLAALGSALWVQRHLSNVPALEAAAASVGWLILPLAMGVVAWYLRWSEVTRGRAIAAAKAEQRLLLAVDLHDYVAHDVSEIVARAQAGAAVLPLGDPRIAELLAQIETAGIRALESMDRAVRALREDDELANASRGGIDDIEQLVHRFAAAGEIDVRVDRRVNGHIDGAIGAEAHRAVVEALTNVRRHAMRATAVVVRLHQMHDRLLVSIVDDGESEGPRRDRMGDGATSTGGLGLAAMAERVQLLGGAVEAGPQPPRGWKVTVTLPLTPSSLQGGRS